LLTASLNFWKIKKYKTTRKSKIITQCFLYTFKKKTISVSFINKSIISLYQFIASEFHNKTDAIFKNNCMMNCSFTNINYIMFLLTFGKSDCIEAHRAIDGSANSGNLQLTAVSTRIWGCPQSWPRCCPPVSLGNHHLRCANQLGCRHGRLHELHVSCHVQDLLSWSLC
jgi:hypothetical protein